MIMEVLVLMVMVIRVVMMVMMQLPTACWVFSHTCSLGSVCVLFVDEAQMSEKMSLSS